MKRYFEVKRPEEQSLPIVVDVPHAGEWIPEEVAEEMVVGDQTLRRDLDLYVDEIWMEAPNLGATLIYSKVSRYVVDLNRAADDVSPRTVVGAQRVDRPGYYHDRGVVWRTTTDGTPVMAGAMSATAFQRRIETFHAPYHRAIQEEIDRVVELFGYCILVDGHSMPSMGRSGHSDPGTRRADIVPGDVNGTSCGPKVTQLIEKHYKSAGYSVNTNTPYVGGWITRNFGDPSKNVHAIQIELNRDLYMNESTFEKRTLPMKLLSETCVSLLPKLGKLTL